MDRPAFRFAARLAAWCLLGLIVIATLSPIDLRPETGAAPWLERFCAYLAMAGAFAVGYPNRVRWIAVGVVLAAVLLEMGQNLSPTRHGRPLDALEKAAGGLAGVAAGAAVWRIWERKRGPRGG